MNPIRCEEKYPWKFERNKRRNKMTHTTSSLSGLNTVGVKERNGKALKIKQH